MRKRLMARAIPAFYWGATYAIRAVLTIVGRWKAHGRERIPDGGGLIVVSNHLSNADPPILGAGFARRRIRFMAKIELYRYPFGAVPRLYGAFPVKRFDADLGALLNAERMLKRGEVIGMFPEGTRSRTGKIGKPLPGTAVIALRSGATVLPCAIAGTEQLSNPLNLLRKPKISVTLGEPIRVAQVKRPSEEQVTDLTNRIFAAITTLLPAKYIDTYTGSEETPPADAELAASQAAHGPDSAGI